MRWAPAAPLPAKARAIEGLGNTSTTGGDGPGELVNQRTLTGAAGTTVSSGWSSAPERLDQALSSLALSREARARQDGAMPRFQTDTCLGHGFSSGAGVADLWYRLGSEPVPRGSHDPKLVVKENPEVDRPTQGDRAITCPKMTCFLSNHGVGTVQMKNWEPFVFLPALAIERTPGLLWISSGCVGVGKDGNAGGWFK